MSLCPLPPLTLPIPQRPWNSKAKKLEALTRKAINEFKLLEGHHKVAVALSGGKDSLALLFMLHAINGRGVAPFSLYAIHITGEFSCGAGVSLPLLEAICKELNIPFKVKTLQKREKLECYSCSRDRRRLLFDAAKEEGIKAIAFGHHKDDSVQTLMMNLLHQGEFEPLHPKVSMQRYGVDILRPLYFVDEELVVAFAKSYGFSRLTCQCPVGQHSMRKKTAELLEYVQELYPHAKNNLFQAALRFGSKKALSPSTKKVKP